MGLTKNALEKVDKAALKLAVEQFEQFCKWGKVDKVQFYVCMESDGKKSDGMIAQALGISPEAVLKRRRKCKE